MALTLQEVKYVDDSNKRLVFGFIREIEAKCSIQNTPPLILYTCLLYYYATEYFDKCGTGVNISDDKMTITKDSASGTTWNNTTYCKNFIDSTSKGIVKWTFKMNKFHTEKDHNFPSSDICIGITSTEDNTNKDWAFGASGFYYASGNLGKFFQTDNDSMNKCNANRDSIEEKIKFGESDQITLILDLEQRKIFQQINAGEKYLIWKQIKVDENVKYKVAVTLRYPNNSMTLVEYIHDIKR
eukprot:194194_1